MKPSTLARVGLGVSGLLEAVALIELPKVQPYGKALHAVAFTLALLTRADRLRERKLFPKDGAA